MCVRNRKRAWSLWRSPARRFEGRLSPIILLPLRDPSPLTQPHLSERPARGQASGSPEGAGDNSQRASAPGAPKPTKCLSGEPRRGDGSPIANGVSVAPSSLAGGGTRGPGRPGAYARWLLSPAPSGLSARSPATQIRDEDHGGSTPTSHRARARLPPSPALPEIRCPVRPHQPDRPKSGPSVGA